MSGGSLDYAHTKINQLADDIDSTTQVELHVEFSKFLRRIAKAAHDLEWVLSDDCSPGSEVAALRGVMPWLKPRIDVSGKALCYRCEWRAQWLESGHGPRMECQSRDSATGSCYMYRPVAPVIQQVNDGDDRSPFSGAMVSARSHAIGIAKDLDINSKVLDKKNRQFILWLSPKENKEEAHARVRSTKVRKAGKHKRARKKRTSKDHLPA